jgi:hypothetical protein
MHDPIRLIAEINDVKPAVCLSAMSASSSDIYMVLSRCVDLSRAFTSAWANELEDLVSNLSPLLNRCPRDLWMRPLRGFVLERHQSRSSRNCYSVTNSEFIHSLPGCRELTSIQWTISAARAVLRHIYESEGELPTDYTVLQELASLTESLESRKHLIECCARDAKSLQAFEELCGVYRSEIALLTEMISSRQAGCRSHHRNEDECIFALSKLCHRQFDIELKISRGAAASSDKERSPSSSGLRDAPLTPTHREKSAPSTPGNHQGIARKKTNLNPLWLVMQNVFPSDDISKGVNQKNLNSPHQNSSHYGTRSP